MILAAILIALVLTFLLALFFGRPLRGLWIFFVVLFLVTWASQLWITPLGPVAWGVTWAPAILAAVFFTLLILALAPPPSVRKSKSAPPPMQEAERADEAAFIGTSVFFWMLVIALLLFIGMGYYRAI